MVKFNVIALKKALRRLLQVALIFYVVGTLPLVTLFFWNATCRNTFLNIATHYRSKVIPIRTVHIGDSITAGGGHWSLRLGSMPLDAYNLAGNGYTVAQIRQQVPKALSYSPEVICVLGGTNDLFDPRFDLEFTVSSYDALLSEIKTARVPCIVTLVPCQSSRKKTEQIRDLNSRLETLAASHGCAVIDLNPVIAPDGQLLPQYTTDGTRFSEAGYGVWARELSREIAHAVHEPRVR